MTWSDAPSASTPTSESTPAASASADVTVPPAAATTPEGSTPAPGEPPKERWDAILANARQKAADEALAPLAWARGVNPQEFQQMQQIARHFTSGNAVEGIKNLIAELRRDPAINQQLTRLHAQELAALRGQPKEPDLNPIQVQLDNGQTVGLYSADQIAALRQQWLNDVRQELQPIAKSHEQLQADRAEAVRQHQIEHFTTTTFADAQTWPGMDSQENRTAVAKEMAQARINPNDPGQVQLALNAAWRKVVVPTLKSSAEATLLDSLKTKAQASTSVNPGSAAPSAPRTVTRFDQLGAEAWR